MTIKQYIDRMNEIGIDRGNLADGAKIEAQIGHTPLAKEPQTFHRKVGERIKAPEAVAVDPCNDARSATMKRWWKNLKPEDRARHNAQRAKNARAK